MLRFLHKGVALPIHVSPVDVLWHQHLVAQATLSADQIPILHILEQLSVITLRALLHRKCWWDLLCSGWPRDWGTKLFVPYLSFFAQLWHFHFLPRHQSVL